MSQDQKPPSFLDDPGFQAELAALDRGLRGPGPPDDKTAPPPSEQQSARAAPGDPIPVESPATPAAIFPESTLARDAQSPPASRFARGEARAGMPGWADAATPEVAGPRPLLTLFPPPLGQRERVHHPAGSGRSEQQIEERGPVTAGTPPPRIVRSRLALEADAAELARTRDQPTPPSAYEESVAAAVADLELMPERSDEGRVVGIVGRAIILLALMLAGAAAAAWVYWAQVSQLLSR